MDEIWDALEDELHTSGGESHFYYEALDKAKAHERRANRAEAKLSKLIAVIEEHPYLYRWLYENYL